MGRFVLEGKLKRLILESLTELKIIFLVIDSNKTSFFSFVLWISALPNIDKPGFVLIMRHIKEHTGGKI
jgi:hypothetical protein